MISLLLSPRGNLIIVTISSLLVTLGSSAVFLAITRKKKVLCVMGAFPSVLTSFVTGERPFVVSAIGCAILGYVYLSPRVLSAKKVSALVLIGLLSVLLLNSVLIGRGPDVGIPDVVHNSLYPVVRDSSTPTLYYCFGESMLMDQGTEFRGIKFLVKTGFFPGTLWGTRDFAEADVPSYLATKWFAWSAGSVHPAIYGWAFVDMKWYGVLFGVYVGFFSSLLVRWARRDWFQRAIVISALSMFFTVGGRGSVQVGYSRTIYVVVVGLLVAKLLIRSPVSANRIDEETGHFALDSR
jgi:hypothetical protein